MIARNVWWSKWGHKQKETGNHWSSPFILDRQLLKSLQIFKTVETIIQKRQLVMMRTCRWHDCCTAAELSPVSPVNCGQLFLCMCVFQTERSSSMSKGLFWVPSCSCAVCSISMCIWHCYSLSPQSAASSLFISNPHPYPQIVDTLHFPPYSSSKQPKVMIYMSSVKKKKGSK